MRHAAAIVLLLFTGPAWSQVAAGTPADRAGFQAQVAASVLSAALAFIAPRALDAVTVQQLAMWGLAGPTALDNSITAELREASVVLIGANRILFERKRPAPGDAEGWGTLMADMLAASAAASPQVAAAGPQAVLSSAFDEMFNHLDPYSRYVPPGAADVDRARRTGEAGAGITVKRVGRAFVVSDINGDGPGAEAGIRLGDRVIAVDEQPTAGESLETVIGWIAGAEGSSVTITVRGRTGPARALEVERAIAAPETVFARRMNDLLVVRIGGFSVDTDQRFEQELTRNLSGAAGRGVRGIVLDLRGNRGGLLRQAVAATDLLLDRGIIATTAGRNPTAAHEWRARTGDITNGKPLIVLVDGRSASAAEIMAAALADQGRGVVVGSATLGKGLVQTITNLPDDGELFVSWSRVLAPHGWPLQGLGVLPQVCTSLGQEQTTQQLDALDRGTLAMAPALARHNAARAPLPAAEVLALRSPCPAAEARDADFATARYLVAHKAAYAAALLPPPHDP